MRFIRAISTYKPAKANWRTTISAGELPATNRKGYDEMSYAKPQDGSTVKGYRTLGPKEVGDMNELKQATREWNALLEKQKIVGR